MAAVTIPDTMKVECLGTVNGRPWVNVFHCELTATLDSTLATAVKNAFLTQFYDEFNDSLSTLWSVSTIKVTDIRTASGPQFNFTVVLAGGVTQELLSPDTALCISWVTSLRGKSYRGRNYLAGFTEASNDAGGVVNPASATNVVDAGTTLRAALNTAGAQLVVASTTLGSSRPVTGHRVNLVWDRQRRRQYRQ